MKITKSQLKQIIKEELQDTLNEKLQGGIDELAQEYGVTPLPERFTNQQLVDFTYELIEAMPRAEMGPVSGPRALAARKQGETHKQRAEKYAAADLGSRLATPHVLSTSGVGHALEKLLMKRKSQEQNEEMRQALEDARMALLNAVSPSGRQAALRTAKTAERGQRQLPGSEWGPSVAGQRRERAKWSKQFNESQLEQIIKEEISEVLGVQARQAVLDKPGIGVGSEMGADTESAVDQAIKKMASAKPNGPIGLLTIQAAIESNSLTQMVNTIAAALEYLSKIRMRYAGPGSRGSRDSWAQNQDSYGSEPTERHEQEGNMELTKLAAQDLERLGDLVS